MRTHALLSALAAFSIAMCTSAAFFTCDLTQGDGSAVAAPTGIQVGDTVAISLPDGVSFSFLISAAPPAGIAGPSFIARDAASGASAVLKPLAGGGMRGAAAGDSGSRGRDGTPRRTAGIFHMHMESSGE